MCAIIDASVFREFIDPNNKDMAFLKKWIETKGKIGYSPTEKLEEELKNGPRAMRRWMDFYIKSPRVKRVNKEATESKTKEFAKRRDMASNDPHVLALADVGGINVLATKDRDLMKDFKGVIRGRIYQKRRAHGHLLSGRTCP